MALKIIGGILVLFGLADFIGSFAGFDLWGIIGLQLPDLLWSFSAYIEMGLGYFLFNLGSGDEEETVE